MSLKVLVQRMGFGRTAEESALATSLGAAAYIDHHLNPQAIDDSALDQVLAAAAFNTLTMTPQQLSQAGGTAPTQLVRARILRAVQSKRQLLERVVEFWTDHFNISLESEPEIFLKTVDDRDVLRPNALGSFRALLGASAHSPAMLAYLDNDTNTAAAPNENYARELMELHTLGVTGGYTQQDVAEVARCFTGWTYWRAAAGATAYTFRYQNSIHDNGQKTVLGHVIPAGGGQQDAETVLDILAAHPSTATFICTKLARWFWGDPPDPALVSLAASTFQATAGNIKEVVRVILLATAAIEQNTKYKRPFDLFTSGLRALSANITTPGSLQTPLIGAGQLPFNWSPPDGYPDSLEFWVGLLLPRWNFGASLLNAEFGGGVSVNYTALLAGATTGQQVMDRLDSLLFEGAMPPGEKSAILTYIGGPAASPSDARKREAIGLALAAPAFQWY